MSKPIVFLQEDEGDSIIEWVEDLYGRRDTEIVVAKILDENEYRSRMESGSSRSEFPSIDELESQAEAELQELVTRVVDRDTDDYVFVGSVARLPNAVYETADEYDCDHLLVESSKRSPAGKAIFGDLKQNLIMNFKGATTIVVDD